MILSVTGSRMKVANATFILTADELTMTQTYGNENGATRFHKNRR